MQKLSTKDKVIAAIIAALIAGSCAGLASFFGIGHEETPEVKEPTEQVELAK